jgi:hypothetical protein
VLHRLDTDNDGEIIHLESKISILTGICEVLTGFGPEAGLPRRCQYLFSKSEYLCQEISNY